MRHIRSTYRRPISDREQLERDKDAELMSDRAQMVEDLMDPFFGPQSPEEIKQAIERDQQKRFEVFQEWRNTNRARRALGLTTLPRPAGV